MPQPSKIPLPFAASGDKNTIPESTETTGLVSWRDGFPAITSAPFSEGGIAPKRADFNGIFNALSAAAIWYQQGGFFVYDDSTNYEIGNIVIYSGEIYVCKTANGPASALHSPANDTAEKTYWGRIYPQNGTFDRMFFSQTSGTYTAPYTGVYRITLKGGGGGGSGADNTIQWTGAGGGEGGILVFYTQLTKNAVYPYVIGAGGAAGTNKLDASGTAGDGGGGGATSFNSVYSVSGAGGSFHAGTSTRGGTGGRTYTAPTGSIVHFIPGASGVGGLGYYGKPDGTGNNTLVNSLGYSVGGGNGGGFYESPAIYGGGGGGGKGTTQPSAGGAGYILIEYAG